MTIFKTPDWSSAETKTVVATFLGWALDAFDFFMMVFVLEAVAHEFKVSISKVAVAIMLTLAMRPVGAFLFGRLADHFGRKPLLMLNVALFSVLAFCSALAPNLITLLILRAAFGIAMGGEWGIGSALAMETIQTRARGMVSGILQMGYPVGYLLASLVYGLFFNVIGWRGLFMVGIIPALLVFFIRKHIPESPAWKATANLPRQNFMTIVLREWKLTVFAILLMTCFNFLAHGSQDLYPTFLQVEHHFDAHVVSIIAIIYNIGAIIGTLCFSAISENFGRRRTIALACVLVLPVLPLWAFGNGVLQLTLGAFLLQFFVQGAWSVIPAHLNEISPKAIRATFPGLVYQLGNLLASVNATLQIFLATRWANGNYSFGLALVVGTVALCIVALIHFSPERRGLSLGGRVNTGYVFESIPSASLSPVGRHPREGGDPGG